jgi:hypothetical protein
VFKPKKRWRSASAQPQQHQNRLTNSCVKLRLQIRHYPNKWKTSPDLAMGPTRAHYPKTVIPRRLANDAAQKAASRSIVFALERFDVFRCAILAASHAAISMVVQFGADSLEARFWPINKPW